MASRRKKITACSILFVSSFTDEATALKNGYSFFPEKLSLKAYRYIAEQWELIGNGYLVSIIVTFVGILPMLVLFPVFQKWFVKGATAGAVKE